MEGGWDQRSSFIVPVMIDPAAPLLVNYVYKSPPLPLSLEERRLRAMAANTAHQNPRLPAPQFRGQGPMPGNTFGGELTNAVGGMSKMDQRVALFGAGPTNYNQDEYASMDIETHILPDDWKRIAERNVARVISQEIDAHYEYIVTTLLPWTRFDGGNVMKMSRLIFNTHQLDEVPETGVVRFVTNNYEEWVSNIPRRGIGFLMENGFLMTPTGLLHYGMSVKQIQNATINTACTQAIYTILATKASNNWYETFGVPPSKQQLNSLFEYECGLWAILSEENGIERLQDMAAEIISYRGVKPDVLIVSEGSSRTYKNMPVHQQEMAYMIEGPNGPKIKHGEGPMAAFSKYKLYELRKFQIGAHAMPEDLLQSVRSIGDLIVFSHEGHREVPVDKYTSQLMNVTVLNHNRNAMQEVSFRDHIDNSPLFLPNGELSPQVGTPFFRTKAANGTFGEFLLRFGADHAKKFFDSVDHKLARVPMDENDPQFNRVFGRDVMLRTVQNARKKGTRPNQAGTADKIKQALERLLEELHSTDVVAAASVDRNVGLGDASTWFSALNDNYEAHTARANDAKTWARDYVNRDEVTIRSCPVDLRPAFFAWICDEDAQSSLFREVVDTLQADKSGHLSWFDFAAQHAIHHKYISGDRLTTLQGLVDRMEANADNSGIQTNAGFSSKLHAKVNAIQSTDAKNFYAETHREGLRSWHELSSDFKHLVEHVVALCTVVVHNMPTEVLRAKGVARNELFRYVKEGLLHIFKEVKKGLADVPAEASSNTTKLLEIAFSDGLGTASHWEEYLDRVKAVGPNDRAALFYDLFETESPLLKHTHKATSGSLTRSGWTKLLKEFPIDGLTRDFFLFLIDHDVWFPFHGMSVRPHIEWLMTSAILMKEGAETGSTFRGNPNMLMSVDGQRKMLMGNFTLYLGSVIREPANILLLHNVGCKDYVRGGGVDHWEPFNAAQRKSYRQGQIPRQQAFFSVPLYPDERIDQAFIDITGHFPANLRGGADIDEDTPHYKMAAQCAAVWGWVQEDEAEYMDLGFYPRSSYRNTRCAMAHQYHYKIINGIADPRGHQVIGTGHWEFSYDGCVKERTGKSKGPVMVRRDTRVTTLSL